MVLCMPEPAVSLCLTFIAERKLASSPTITSHGHWLWGEAALLKMACCLLRTVLLRWRKARRWPCQSLLTSSMKFETTGGEALSGLLLSLKPNCLWVLRSGVRVCEIKSCLQHTDFCWLSTGQQPWGIGFPLRAGSAPSAGNGPVQDDKW